MYAEGHGLRGIAVQLNTEGVRGPNGVWSRYTIHEMLRNERYRGVSVWGRTQKARNPETGRKVSRATSASQQRRVEVPDWRIVSEDLWLSVEARRKESGAAFHKNGGTSTNGRGGLTSSAGIWFVGIAAAAWSYAPEAESVGTLSMVATSISITGHAATSC
jgi:site-specific DNA recombinase